MDLTGQHLRINYQSEIINHGKTHQCHRAGGGVDFNLGNVTSIGVSWPRGFIAMGNIHWMRLAYYRQLRAIVADSEPGERVVVANVQLFALDEGPWGR